MFLKIVLEINFDIFNKSNKHCGTIFENIKHVFVLFKKRNNVILNANFVYWNNGKIP